MGKDTAIEFYPKKQSDWRAWLAENHDQETGVWLIFYKKNSGAPNLSWSESVDEALCFGWIDGTKKSIDEKRYKQYFCPRKPKSGWSKVNKEKVDLLINEKLMMPSGLAAIERAKENGSWSLLDEIEQLIVPEDLKQQLGDGSEAFRFFDGLSASAKKILLHWVMSAKRPETRQKRIGDIVENAQIGQKPKQFR